MQTDNALVYRIWDENGGKGAQKDHVGIKMVSENVLRQLVAKKKAEDRNKRKRNARGKQPLSFL